MLLGQITEWNAMTGRGLVTSSVGVHSFGFADCDPRLQSLLAGKTIPPDSPITVRFDLSAQNYAINLSGDDTTQTK